MELPSTGPHTVCLSHNVKELTFTKGICDPGKSRTDPRGAVHDRNQATSGAQCSREPSYFKEIF